LPGIGVGVIGLGRNGSAFLPIYARHPVAELVGVSDLSTGKLRRAQSEFDLSVASTDYSELLERDDIHLISIHTPDHLHKQPFVDALRAGKHVFVEKPMANSIPDLLEMTEAARRSGAKVLVGQILRFNPMFRRIKEMVSAGDLGDIFYAAGDYIHDLRYQANQNDDVAGTNWYLEVECPIVGGSVHPVDLLRWYAGDIVEAHAFGSRLVFPEMKEDAGIIATFRFASGAIGKSAALYAPRTHMPKAYNLTLYGTKGTIIGDSICMEGESEFRPLDVPCPPGHPYDPEVDHMLDCIINDWPTICDAFDGARSAAAVLAARESLLTGVPVKVPNV
jgi:predicted dehydrogenase